MSVESVPDERGDGMPVIRRCSHRRTRAMGPAGRFCDDCGQRVDVPTCGAVHERARAVCTLPLGHDGDHWNAQGYWMPRAGERHA